MKYKNIVGADGWWYEFDSVTERKVAAFGLTEDGDVVPLVAESSGRPGALTPVMVGADSLSASEGEVPGHIYVSTSSDRLQ